MIEKKKFFVIVPPLSKITVNKKLKCWLSLNYILRFEGLKRSPYSFHLRFSFTIIDIFRIIKKTFWTIVLLFWLYYTTKNTKDLHKVHKVSLIDYTLFLWDFQLVTFHFQLVWALPCAIVFCPFGSLTHPLPFSFSKEKGDTRTSFFPIVPPL